MDLLLAPLLASNSHGYDTLDRYRVDPRLGDDADVDELVRQTKHRGVRLSWRGPLGRHAEFSRAFQPQTFLGNHDVTRIASQLTDPRHLPLAVALLMVLPGIPAEYAGDEQGFTGKRLDQPHGDDAVRPPFPETPAGLSPLGTDVLGVHQELIALRRDHAWLVDAELATSEVSNTTMAVHLSKDDHHLTLALNAGDEAATVCGQPVLPHSYRVVA